MPRSTDRAATDTLLGRLLAAIEQELPRAVALRHRLHALPELAHAESETAVVVSAELPVAAVSAAGTGRIARIGRPELPAVAVRAELDGLPIDERTGAVFRARGKTMHACGHDVHMAALVALARAAQALADELPAQLLAVFQPSEEAYPSGAEQLARGELAAAAPAAFVGAHIQPELPWGAVALDAGPVNASSDSVQITIAGEPTHAAYPHRGRDPVLALAHVIVALHAQTARRTDPIGPSVINVGALEGGQTENVVPSLARARVALRAYRPQDRLALRRMVEEVVQGIAIAHGCRGNAELWAGEPALENDPEIVARARELLVGRGLAMSPEWRSCGSDDFAFFSELAPIAMAFVGLAGAEGFAQRPLHHPELLPPDSAVGAIARVQAALYVAAASTRAQVL